MVNLIATPISPKKRATWHRATGADSLPIRAEISPNNKYTIDHSRLSHFQLSALAAHVGRVHGLTRAAALRALLRPSIAVDAVLVGPDGDSDYIGAQLPLLVGEDVAGVGWAVAY